MFAKPMNINLMPAADLDESQIDPSVLNLVRAFNGSAYVETVASCQGHLSKVGGPYVYFRAPDFTAASLEQALRTDRVIDTPELRFSWEITGMFDADFRLSWLLRSPTLEALEYLSVRWFWVNRFRRRWIDEDMRQLAIIVEELLPRREVLETGRTPDTFAI